MATYPALPYLPQSVRFVSEGADYVVVDTDGSIYHRGEDAGYAARRFNVRRGVVKATVTRRLNKKIADRNERRAQECEANNVTWAYLRQELSVAEADAWLGLD